MRRAEFDVNEHPDFVRRLEEFLFGNDRVKSDVIKPELLRLFKVFKVKIFKRKPEKICVVVRFCSANITAYINGLAVYRDILAVLSDFAKTESAADLFFFSVGICNFNPISVQCGVGKRP